MCRLPACSRLSCRLVSVASWVFCPTSWLMAAAIGAASLHGQSTLHAQSPHAGQPAASKPDCLVSDLPPTSKAAPATIADDLRRTIFVELQQAVVRAQREAAAAYPAAEGGAMLSPTNVQKDRTLTVKRGTLERSLERSYVQDVLKTRSLSCAVAREIAREGRDAHWPGK